MDLLNLKFLAKGFLKRKSYKFAKNNILLLEQIKKVYILYL